MYNGGMIANLGLVGLLIGHLLLMQLAGAGPLACMILEWSGGRASPADRVTRAHVGKNLAKNCVFAIIAGSLLALMMVWMATATGQRDYSSVIERFYSRVWWGGWELVTYLVAMLIYWLGWDRLSQSTAGRCFHRFVAIFAVTNLLYHFPPLLTVMVDAMNSTDAVPSGPITSAEFRGLIFQTPVLAKTLHFGFASLAIVGAWLMGHVGVDSTIIEHSEDGEVAYVAGPPRLGGLLATIAIAMQLLIGLWLVVLAPATEQAAIMGKDSIAAACLFGGILLSLVALNQSAAVAMGEGKLWQARMAAATIGITVVLMILVTARLGGLI